MVLADSCDHMAAHSRDRNPCPDNRDRMAVHSPDRKPCLHNRDRIVAPRCVCGYHGAAWFAELWGLSPQARNYPVYIGDLGTAQPLDIRRAGHLLCHGSAILLRDGAI
jgi:hypothetical protein